jgi:hypothetical protein
MEDSLVDPWRPPSIVEIIIFRWEGVVKVRELSRMQLGERPDGRLDKMNRRVYIPPIKSVIRGREILPRHSLMAREVEIMEDRDVRRDHGESESAKQPYEPPQATLVSVRLEERVLGCNFSTFQVCGLTE